jgi:hypothetical protein
MIGENGTTRIPTIRDAALESRRVSLGVACMTGAMTMCFSSRFHAGFTWVCLVAGVVSLAGCGWTPYRANGTRSKVVDHIAGADLDVQTQNGLVEVLIDASRSHVTIESTITCDGHTQAEADQRLADTRLIVERRTDRTLMIRPEFPPGALSNDGARITVRMPDVGAVNVKTSNGRIELNSAAGQATLATSNGKVLVSDHRGPLHISTSNGRIDITDLHGDIDARTSNGPVRITHAQGRIDVDTSNGRIDCVMAATARGPVNLETSNGSIHLTVGTGFAGRLDMHTSNGRVDVEGSLDAARHVVMKEKSGYVEMAEGTGRSDLRSSNGSITLTILTGGASADDDQSADD